MASHEDSLERTSKNAPRDSVQLEEHQMEHNYHTNISGPSQKKKGVLLTERQGKGYLYYPAVSEQDCQLAEGQIFLNRVYDGSLAKHGIWLHKGGSLSNDELAALKELIEKQERKRMSVLGNVFNIVIFVSLVGSVFSVLSLLAKKVLNIALPLWFGVCGMVFTSYRSFCPHCDLFRRNQPRGFTAIRLRV